MVWVPGCLRAAAGGHGGRADRRFDAVICLGAVIRGETSHYDFVAGECAAGLQRVQLDMALPVVFGVLTTENLDQALARAGGARRQQGHRGGRDGGRDGERAHGSSRPGRRRWNRRRDGLAAAAGARTQRRHRARARPMLRLVLPKGSLEQATFELFAAADLAVRRASDVDYRATIDDPRVDEVHILRPQEIPTYVAEGLFDLGVTGRDWVEETGADVVSLGELQLLEGDDRAHPGRARGSGRLAGQKVEDLPQGCRVSTEYPRLTERFLAERGVEAEVRFSYGATEAKVPDIADAVVEITETGRALRAAGLRVIDTLLTSYTELIANPVSAADPDKARAMGQLLVLLQGALEARGKVLVKLNVAPIDLPSIIAVLPSMRSPTVVEALRRSRLRRRGGRSQVRDQRPHPGAEGAGSDGHHRAPDREDRPLSGLAGAAPAPAPVAPALGTRKARARPGRGFRRRARTGHGRRGRRGSRSHSTAQRSSTGAGRSPSAQSWRS